MGRAISGASRSLANLSNLRVNVAPYSPWAHYVERGIGFGPGRIMLGVAVEGLPAVAVDAIRVTPPNGLLASRKRATRRHLTGRPGRSLLPTPAIASTGRPLWR